jgi:RND superfamily putative drug exporter
LILERLARFCYRRRRYVLVVWLIALIGVTVLSKTAGGKDATKFSLPGTESQKAFDLLQTKFPARTSVT